jgi:hypothetical protein
MPISVLGSCPSSKGEAERNIAYFVVRERKAIFRTAGGCTESNQKYFETK